MNIKLEISSRLKEMAQEKNLSLADISRLLDMKNPQGLNPYVNGSSILGGEKLAILAKNDFDIFFLLTGERGKLLNGEILERLKKLEESNNRLEKEVEELKEYKELSLKLLIENRSLSEEVEQLRVQSEKDIVVDVHKRMGKKE